jgi:hypothetical protein
MHTAYIEAARKLQNDLDQPRTYDELRGMCMKGGDDDVVGAVLEGLIEQSHLKAVCGDLIENWIEGLDGIWSSHQWPPAYIQEDLAAEKWDLPALTNRLRIRNKCYMALG